VRFRRFVMFSSPWSALFGGLFGKKKKPGMPTVSRLSSGEIDRSSLFPDTESMFLGGDPSAPASDGTAAPVGKTPGWEKLPWATDAPTLLTGEKKPIKPWTQQQWREWKGTRATMAARKRKTLLGAVA